MPDQCSAPKYLTLHNHFPYLLQSLFYNFCMLYHSPILEAFLLNLKALLGRDLVYFFFTFLPAWFVLFSPLPLTV